MENTENLALPYIMPSQAQKHVTHNEALRMLDAIVHLAVADKDLAAPPSSPGPGARHIVGAAPTGAWSGHAGKVAAWQDGAWAFYTPAVGWLAWVHHESRHYLFSGGGWTEAPGGGGAGIVPKGAWSDAQSYSTGDLVEHGGHAFLSNTDDNADNEPDSATPGSTLEWTYFAIAGAAGGAGTVNPAPLVGVNATADTGNRLSVASPAALFSHDGDDHRLKINKAAAGDTASVLFQTGFIGHAEFGLAGDNDWHVKVSPDGAAWHEAIVVDRSTGAVSFPNTSGGGGGGGRELLTAPRTYHVDGSAGNDANNGLSSGTAFATIQKAVDTAASLDLGVHDVTISVATGTYATPVVLKSLVGAGDVILSGDEGTPSNVVISVADGPVIGPASAIVGTYRVRGFRLTTAGSSAASSILTATGAGCAVYFRNLEFGAASGAHINAARMGLVEAEGSYSIVGGADRHWWATNQGIVSVTSRAITLTGTPAFGSDATRAFAVAQVAGLITCAANTYSGSATGKRYRTVENGTIRSNGSTLPGNAAGDAADAGVYT